MAEKATDETAASKTDAVTTSVERCLELVLFLQSVGDWVTTADLYNAILGYADAANESARRKQFDRDREYLAAIGIEVQRLSDPNADDRTRWRLAPTNYSSQHTISLDGFTSSELAALSATVAATSLGAWSDPVVQPEVADQLGGLVDVDVSQVAEIRQSTPQLVDIIAGAVNEHRRLRFSYSGVLREVEPYRVTLRNGRWYLRAVDTSTAQLMTYRVDRIEEYPRLAVGAVFARDHQHVEAASQELQLDPLRFRRDEPIRLRVEFDQAAVSTAESLADVVDVSLTENDGQYIVEFDVNNYVAAYSLLLPMLHEIRRIVPQSFVAGMRTRLVQAGASIDIKDGLAHG